MRKAFLGAIDFSRRRSIDEIYGNLRWGFVFDDQIGIYTFQRRKN